MEDSVASGRVTCDRLFRTPSAVNETQHISDERCNAQTNFESIASGLPICELCICEHSTETYMIEYHAYELGVGTGISTRSTAVLKNSENMRTCPLAFMIESCVASDSF